MCVQVVSLITHRAAINHGDVTLYASVSAELCTYYCVHLDHFCNLLNTIENLYLCKHTVHPLLH